MGLVGLLLLAMCRGSSYDDLETRECVSVKKRTDSVSIYVVKLYRYTYSKCTGTQRVQVLKGYRYSKCPGTQSVPVLKGYRYSKCTGTQSVPYSKCTGTQRVPYSKCTVLKVYTYSNYTGIQKSVHVLKLYGYT